MNKSLPIVNNISYSTLTDFHRCPWYFKVKNVDKISDFSTSVKTIYGTLIHKNVQDILLDKISPEDAYKRFNRTWKKFCGLYKKHITVDTEFAYKSSELIFTSIKTKFQEWWPNYKVLSVEYRLLQPASEKWEQNFKGFVDLNIQTEDGDIFILDLKTSDSLYSFKKYRDKIKDYQLILYKLFYSMQESVDLDNIKLAFVILDTTKDPVSLLKITSGAKRLDNALEWLGTNLSAINRQVFLRNRSNCQMYGKPCKFYKSEYCK